jgi:hypothetical protein
MPSDPRKELLSPHLDLERGGKEKPKKAEKGCKLLSSCMFTFGSAFTVEGRARETSIVGCYLSNAYLANCSDHVRGDMYSVH